MASTHKHIRSSTANKRPTTALADGQIALNTNASSPGLFFKDSTGAIIIKIGPVHVGSTAPNATPGAGGSSGNSTGEIWLDNSLTPVGVKIWNGSAWVNATPVGSTTVQGLLELATSAETQAGTDTDRAVTPAGLQSKVSDSTSTTSSTTIASSTAVKSAYDLANAALPKSGGTITGNLEIGTTGSLSFEGSTADAFETTITVTDPTADRTITLPDTTGTVVTTGDTGTVTSTMIANGTIVDADINASAAIADTKLATISTAGKVNGTALTGTIPSAVLGNSSTFVGTTSIALNRSSANQALTGISSVALPGSTSGTVTVQPTAIAGTTTITLPATTGTVVTTGDSGTVTSTMIADGTIVNGDINASAAIAGTKISPDFGSQTVQTTGIFSHALGTAAAPTVTFTGDTNTGIYSPGADQVAISTNGSGRLFVNSLGNIGVGSSPTSIGSNISTIHAKGINGAGIGLGSTSYDQSLVLFTNGDGAAGCLGTYANMPLVFTTNSTERLRITSAGLVGVGTSDPKAALHVAGSSANAFPQSGGALWLSDTNAGLNIKNWSVLSSSGDYRLITGSDTYSGGELAYKVTRTAGAGGKDINEHIWYRGASVETMRLDSSGRLGIGTSSPSSALDVDGIITAKSGTFDAGGFLNKYGADANSRSWWIKTDTHGYGDFAIRQSTTRTGSSYDTKLLIDNSGRVGIGTTSPGARCQISTTTVGDVNLALSGPTGDNNWGGYLTLNSNNGTTVTAGIQASTGGMFFSYGGSERARIDSSGRLLVGTSTSGTSLLQVNAQASASGNGFRSSHQIANSGTGVTQTNQAAPYVSYCYGFNAQSQVTAIAINGEDFAGGDNGLQLELNCLKGSGAVANGDRLGRIRFGGDDGTAPVPGASIDAFVDGTPGANDMPGRLVFSTTADGASSPTERMRITNNGLILGNNSSIFATGRLGTTGFSTGTVNMYLYAGSQPTGTGAYNYYQSIGQGIYQVAAFGGPAYSGVGPGWAIGYAVFSVDYNNAVTIISSNIRNSGDAGMSASFTASSGYLQWSTGNQNYQNYPILFFSRIGANL